MNIATVLLGSAGLSFNKRIICGNRINITVDRIQNLLDQKNTAMMVRANMRHLALTMEIV